jgi:hypothetical protein
MNTDREYLLEHAAQDGLGVWRWKSNGAVPFPDLLERAGINGAVLALHNTARAADTSMLISKLRMQSAQLAARRKAGLETPEERDARLEQEYERRAAFGPGVQLVDVITGETFTT